MTQYFITFERKRGRTKWREMRQKEIERKKERKKETKKVILNFLFLRTLFEFRTTLFSKLQNSVKIFTLFFQIMEHHKSVNLFQKS